MTVKLGTFDFPLSPGVKFGQKADLKEMEKFGGGASFDFSGVSAIPITLTGKLTGSDCYTARDAIWAMLKAGAKVDFYAEAIDYGSADDPKQVWVADVDWTQTIGKVNSVRYKILLIEET